MQELLTQRLHTYLVDHSPEIVSSLQQTGGYTDYLHGKVDSVDHLLASLLAREMPAYEIEEQCMAQMISELGPSRFRYVLDILEEDFSDYLTQFTHSGVRIHAVMSLLTVCGEEFDRFGFSFETQDNRLLRYSIVGAISEYISAEA
ncbi:hypothetical protein [Chitinophaga barathri]|uniref:DUF1896 family protein n=1 Tax=Chitinophaga barathri TaxID=1647451 RepID=A0A3N4MU93_9BACT|nr:hypothetical protein [Chitinophaga barathri]RPD43139.1 hypothetical protein EG028_02255 [Chitinophaga barathri]